MELDGNGWVDCGCGARHWGRHGAAGLFLVVDEHVLLQLRPKWAHEGGSWAIPGGARDSHESVVATALREAQEEAAINPEMSRVIGEVRESLEGGRELSVAFARHPRVFSPFYLSMVRVGEATGLLEEIFLRLFNHLEFERYMREQVKSALRYPLFVMLAMAAAMVISPAAMRYRPPISQAFSKTAAGIDQIMRSVASPMTWEVIEYVNSFRESQSTNGTTSAASIMAARRTRRDGLTKRAAIRLKEARAAPNTMPRAAKIATAHSEETTRVPRESSPGSRPVAIQRP